MYLTDPHKRTTLQNINYTEVEKLCFYWINVSPIPELSEIKAQILTHLVNIQKTHTKRQLI